MLGNLPVNEKLWVMTQARGRSETMLVLFSL